LAVVSSVVFGSGPKRAPTSDSDDDCYSESFEEGSLLDVR